MKKKKPVFDNNHKVKCLNISEYTCNHANGKKRHTLGPLTSSTIRCGNYNYLQLDPLMSVKLQSFQPKQTHWVQFHNHTG